jgi:hypothetical protein
MMTWANRIPDRLCVLERTSPRLGSEWNAQQCHKAANEESAAGPYDVDHVERACRGGEQVDYER